MPAILPGSPESYDYPLLVRHLLHTPLATTPERAIVHGGLRLDYRRLRERIGRLASALGLGRAATGSVIDALERRGYVERQPDPSDRRVWLVDVTTAGKEMVEEVTARDQVLRKELRSGISRDDRHHLADVLVLQNFFR